jgi:hypothetical protein
MHDKLKPKNKGGAHSPADPKPEPILRREKRVIYQHGPNGGTIPIPLDWLRELDWCPGTCEVLLTMNKNETITVEKAKKEASK